MKEQLKQEAEKGNFETEKDTDKKRKNYNRITIILILLLVFLIPMLATYFIFNCDTFVPWIKGSSPGDFLGYFASFFALAATIVIAVKQTEISEKMYDIEDNLLKIEQDRARIEAIERRSRFELTSIFSEGKSITQFNNFSMILEQNECGKTIDFSVSRIVCIPYYHGNPTPVDSTSDPNPLNIEVKEEILPNTSGMKYAIGIIFNNKSGFNSRVSESISQMKVLCEYGYTTNSYKEQYKGKLEVMLYWTDNNKSSNATANIINSDGDKLDTYKSDNGNNDEKNFSFIVTGEQQEFMGIKQL